MCSRATGCCWISRRICQIGFLWRRASVQRAPPYGCYWPSDVRAYELYLKGRGLLYQRGTAVLKGLQCIQEALEIDPGYPMALAGLADANTLMAYRVVFA